MSGKLLFQLPGHNPSQSEWQPRGGNYIALAMDDNVKIWDRSGRVLWDQRAKRAHIKWDYEGQYLAVIQQKMHSCKYKQLVCRYIYFFSSIGISVEYKTITDN